VKEVKLFQEEIVFLFIVEDSKSIIHVPAVQREFRKRIKVFQR